MNIKCTYMVERPFAPEGLRWLRMELKRSVAIVNVDVESEQLNIFDRVMVSKEEITKVTQPTRINSIKMRIRE